MKKQCMNPYLPLDEYIPDGEPHVFGDRLYVFGSHDRENGSEFCELDYVLWSAPLDDLSDWHCDGTIYKKAQDPFDPELLPLYAPDAVQGPDGRYYLYYCVKFQDEIHVAVAARPEGPYEFYGRVSYTDGRVLSENQPYDPSVLVTEEGVFLYYGFAPCMINIPRYKTQNLRGCSAVKLENDMLTVSDGPRIVLPSLKYAAGTDFEADPYFEAPSARYINGKYYLVYSSVNTHRLCYAISDSPMSGFSYGGCIVSNGDVGYKGRTEADKLMSVGNNHGGLAEVRGQWYIFYHRHTSTTQYQRQGCAERVYFDENGHIPQATITTSGMNPVPLSGVCDYPAVYCCNLTNGRMGALSSLGRVNSEVDFPHITSVGGERYIAAISDGTLIGYKYISLGGTSEVGVEYRGDCDGYFEICTSMEGGSAAILPAADSRIWRESRMPVKFSPEASELYLRYRGTGRAEVKTLLLG